MTTTFYNSITIFVPVEYTNHKKLGTYDWEEARRVVEALNPVWPPHDEEEDPFLDLVNAKTRVSIPGTLRHLTTFHTKEGILLVIS